ncbi:hypothetical protein L211DRAFT_838358 [Terfezia boudieri ATCC MYA-4762]|uniref:Uncharacterized protein n=1 Tax=Terfezia boudieri ATCC MYA-4762 TaxID=1051890 RepID=A0A3N4LQF1_9PEZI|nr:hypothetical protein L211DRAFT_838358 [Terfezia boudieri ATCC MYA-4762]
MEAAFRLYLQSTSTAVRSTFGGLQETSSSSSSNEPTSANNAMVSDHDDGVYNPSVQDVLTVKEIIQKASNMPLELIDEIIDFAHYWACSSIKSLFPQSVIGTTSQVDCRGPKDDNILVLRCMPLGYDPACGYLNAESHQRTYQTKAAKPLFSGSDLSFLEPDTASVLEQWAKHSIPRGKNPCRKIVFTLNSRDQGWGGRPEHHGTYKGSYTWFDVGLERFTALKCSESEDRMQTEVQRAMSYAAQGGDGCWLTGPEGRVEWIASSAPLTNVQPSTNSACGGETTPIESSSDPGKINPASNPPPSPGNFLRYNLLTIIPKTVVDLENLRLHHPFLPPATCLQINVMGRAQKKVHVITWSFDDNVNPDSSDGDELEQQGQGRESMTGNFVRSLKLGDVVTVWARARFPGWRNNVEQVKMDIYWAV